LHHLKRVVALRAGRRLTSAIPTVAEGDMPGFDSVRWPATASSSKWGVNLVIYDPGVFRRFNAAPSGAGAGLLQAA
jgi:hypothetical protein